MTNYIELFPKPLLDDLIVGRWLPVIGAGMSRNAITPDNKELPLWKDLGKLISDDLGEIDFIDPIDAISSYDFQYKRSKLVEKLTELLLINEVEPGEAHKAFCDLQFDLVCTTNFDFLLEKQYEKNGRPYIPLIYENQLSVGNDGVEVSIFKLHGDLHHPDRLIATEEDYDLFLYKYPLIATFLANLLITRTAVFIGYSLDDPDFRQIWHIIGERLGKSKRIGYVILVDAKTAAIARFNRRGLKVINLPSEGKGYGIVLKSVFTELYEYWDKKTVTDSYYKGEETRQELYLPESASSRLCFFSLPLSLISLYRENIFPIVREYGLKPTIGDDLIAPGDVLYSKINAIIKRAEVFVSEPTNQNGSFELSKAMEHIDKDKILIILGEENNIISNLADFNFLRRPNQDSIKFNNFLNNVKDWFSKVTQEYYPELKREPIRLMNMGENRAAVVSAISLLEDYLRRKIGITEKSLLYFAPIKELIRNLDNRDLFQNYDLKTIEYWVKVRNEIIHNQGNVSRNLTEDIVFGVDKIVGLDLGR